MRKRTIEDVPVAGRRIFVRVDLNVPLDEGGRVGDDARIRAVLPTIELARHAGARVVLASHLGRPKGRPDPKYSLAPVGRRLGELLGAEVPIAPGCVGGDVEAMVRAVPPGGLVLLENLRFHAEEEANEPAFAAALARHGEVYVNDAFAAAHRAHASTEGITHHLRPAVAGLLMTREIEVLTSLMEAPARPLVAILGGAKVSDKLALVESLLARVDRLLIGGGMAFTFLQAQGHSAGRSLLEADLVPMARRVLEGARARGVEIRLPVDVVVAESPAAPRGETVAVTAIPPDRMGLDIGPATVAGFRAALTDAGTIVWNGPMGVFERSPFAAGTLGLARAVAEPPGRAVIGGGDTVAAVEQAGVTGQMRYLSTGGGAFLEYLEGRTLPGVAALDERD